jgi:hypothetical protein
LGHSDLRRRIHKFFAALAALIWRPRLCVARVRSGFPAVQGICREFRSKRELERFESRDPASQFGLYVGDLGVIRVNEIPCGLQQGILSDLQGTSIRRTGSSCPRPA